MVTKSENVDPGGVPQQENEGPDDSSTPAGSLAGIGWPPRFHGLKETVSKLCFILAILREVYYKERNLNKR